jgi:hypothetical protein
MAWDFLYAIPLAHQHLSSVCDPGTSGTQCVEWTSGEDCGGNVINARIKAGKEFQRIEVIILQLGLKQKEWLKTSCVNWVPMGHACNPNYLTVRLGGSQLEASLNKFVRPHLDRKKGGHVSTHLLVSVMMKSLKQED